MGTQKLANGRVKGGPIKALTYSFSPNPPGRDQYAEKRAVVRD